MDVKLDGIAMCTTSWKSLPLSAAPFIIQPRLSFKNTKKSWVKGSTILNSNIISKLHFGDYSGFEIYLVLQNDVRIDFSHALKNVYKALKDSLQDDNIIGRDTAIRHNQSRFTDHISSLHIFVEDIGIFGTVLYRYINALLPEYEPKFILCKFGQSASFQLMTSILSSVVSTEDICEIIIHAAYDFPSGEGWVLLWNRSEIFSKMRNVENLCVCEYFVGGIPGFGNFTFQSRECNPTPLLGSSKLKKVKFYSSLAKYLSSQKDVPFSQSDASNKLLNLSISDGTMKNYSVELKRCHEDIQCVRSLISKIPTEKQYARVELIINGTICATLKETLELVQTFSDNIVNDFDPSKCIQGFPSGRMHCLMEKTVGVCLDTIQEQLLLAESAITKRGRYILPIDKYKTLLACECITCFMLRGFAVSTIEIRRHENQVVKTLQLGGKMYQEAWSRSEYIFGAIPEIVGEVGGIVYFNDPNNFVPYYLSQLEMDSNYTYSELFDDLKQRDKIYTTAKRVADWILSCTIRKLIGNTHRSNNYKMTHRSITKCTCLTVGSGVEAAKLLENSSSSISWMLHECSRATQASNLNHAWIDALSVHLESCGFQNRDYVCYNYGESENNCIIVLPYCCLSMERIEDAVPVWANTIINLMKDDTGTFDKVLLQAQLELLLQRSVEKLTHSQKANVKLKELIDKLLDGTDKTICQLSNEYRILFAEPFPQKL